MIKYIAILLGAAGLLVHSATAQACDESSSRLVAQVYVLANPVAGRENEIVSLMQQYPNYFRDHGGVIRCMQRLGNALIGSGLAHYQQYAGNPAQQAYGGQLPEGLQHLPGEVDDSLRSYGSDMFAMGQEFLWLARVLPPAAQGNYGPYNRTGTDTRQTLRQVWPIYQQMCFFDQSMCQILTNVLDQMSPHLEQQIYAMARNLGNS